MDARTKGEGSSSKRRRQDDGDDEHQAASQNYSQGQVVPRNKIHSLLHGIPDKTEYQHGSILRVSMRSFVTYESCTFSPGPNLNMIIGPNGTGKSTIVCALALGLGWNTNLLGRAKDISEFVKHGSDKGWIEIVLCNKNGSNVIIKRHINKSNNTSVWKINGENKSQKDVAKKVQSFNIQVDNLCQFLPQDRVSEFAQMSPQELLKETQRAIGGEEMLNAHQKMVELWNEHKISFASIKGDLEAIEANVKRNAGIEKDVVRFQQRAAVLRKIRLLEIWILYAKYGLSKEEYDRLKGARRHYFNIFKELEDAGGPLQEKKRQAEEREQTLLDQKSRLDKMYQKAVQSLKRKGAEVEESEGKGEELRKDLDRLQLKAQQRQSLLTNIRRKVAANQAIVDGAPSEDDINAQKGEIDQKIRALVEESRGQKDSIATLQGQQSDIIDECRRFNMEIATKRKKIDELEDVKNRKLEALRSIDIDVYEAVIWLRDHRHLFKGQVYDPIGIEINVTNMKFVDAIETAIRPFLRTFVCETRADYDVFTAEYLDRMKKRVTIIAPEERSLNMEQYRPPVSQEEFKHWGFQSYVLDALEGPPAVLAVLCAKANIHQVPLTDRNDLDTRGIRDSGKFKRYATLNNMFNFATSKHSREVIETSSQINQARLLVTSFDQVQSDQLIQRVDDLRGMLNEREGHIKELTAEEIRLRNSYKEFTDKQDVLRRRKEELTGTLRKIAKQRLELENSKKELERKEREPSTEAEEERIRQELKKLATKRCKLTLEYVELIKDNQRLVSSVTISTLNRLQAHAALKALEAECTEAALLLQNAEARYTEANDAYERVKDEARVLLDKAKTEYATLLPEDLEEFQALGTGVPLAELEDMLTGEAAKVALHHKTNQSVIDTYEQRAEEIKATKKIVEAKEKRLKKIEADISTIRGPWYTKISQLVSDISESFSASFQKIGCAGEIKLGEHEDYDKWSIDILVKFRDSEKLQKLTGQRQSGGERSVSTIMYLMAMQSLSKVSFRVVDEINQGMDPRNERLVHSQLVEKACKPNTAQYFLITPKLLPNLEYHERMKVLCIYNGEWLEEGVMKWNKYIDNQQRATKAQRL
ncbi:Structural maintenance of chromosomes protein 5 [Linnemannia exigua]|uniref:Structural maintenance of chromosomes protein 5 n=1 Tax=Linnemannia exigua TaxID=604196 RepID=A0AAD4H934_9FUNG|nr:Structural maintenance of chromosomes protein 5 [Linnemannia exigua]